MQELNIDNLIKAGAHFGHETQKWNPKMKAFVYKEQNGIHIIDLRQTLFQTKKAMDFLEEICSQGGRVIFVGTKNQALTETREAAEFSNQFYINKRWLGGTLTNFETVKVSIDRLKKLDKMKERFDLDHYPKKERGRIEKERNKMEEFFKGIKDMKDSPSALFIVDINKEKIALQEAIKLKIPVVALVDTNCDPSFVDFPIPANDDSVRSIRFFTQLAGEACKKGWKKWEKSLFNKNMTTQKQQKSGKSDKPSMKGPDVVNVAKKRKLVAAGTAEDMEIKLELDSAEPEEKNQALSKEAPAENSQKREETDKKAK